MGNINSAIGKDVRSQVYSFTGVCNEGLITDTDKWDKNRYYWFEPHVNNKEVATGGFTSILPCANKSTYYYDKVLDRIFRSKEHEEGFVCYHCR